MGKWNLRGTADKVGLYEKWREEMTMPRSLSEQWPGGYQP